MVTGILIGWFGIGLFIELAWSIMGEFDGFEPCNPYWSHRRYKVNWFGAIVISLFYSALCPPACLMYWFYKLCTWGA